MPERSPGRPAPSWWRRTLLSVVAAVALVGGLMPFLHKGTSELPVYTEGAQRMLAQAEIYRRDDAKPFTYPPFFAVPFVPMTVLSQDQDVQRSVWYGVNVLALCWIIWLLRATVRPMLGGSWREVWFWVVVTGLALRHVLAVFQNQSHDLLVCLPLVLGTHAWARGRRVCGGSWIGVAAACKATPLLFGVAFVVQRRASIGLTLGLVTAFVAASLLPDVLWPRVDGQLWIEAWFQIMVRGIGVGETAAQAGVWNAGSYLNQGLSGTLYRLTTPLEPGTFVMDVAPIHLGETARRIVTIVGQLSVIALIAVTAWPRKSAVPPAWRVLAIASVTVCGMVLLSPMSSKSHFCVLVLPAAFCAAVILRGVGDRVFWALTLGAFALGTLSTKGLLGRSLGEVVLACGSVTWTAALFLLAVAHTAHRLDALLAGASQGGAPTLTGA